MDIRSMQQHNLTERGKEEFNKKLFSDLNHHHHHHEYYTKCSPLLWFILKHYRLFKLKCVFV